MNDEQLRLCQLAIRERRQFLEMLFSKDGSQQKSVRLVGLGRVIFLLATRFVRRPEWPGHEVSEESKLFWEIRWYSDYLQALGELVPPMQAAVRSDRITPRGVMTGAPLSPERMSRWLDLNVKQAIEVANKDFWANAAPTAMGAGWPDAEVMPSGVCVAPNDVATWAEAEGVASSNEVAMLLGVVTILPQTETPYPVTADHSEIEHSDTAPAKWSRGMKGIAWQVAQKLVSEGNAITGPALWEGMAVHSDATVSGDVIRFKTADATLSAGEAEVKASTIKKDWFGQLKKVFTSTA